MRLRTSNAGEPGWHRRRHGKGFRFVDADGNALCDEDVERCKALVIPPAWEDVWVCSDPRGHLQAVGTDAKGRRQYLYHPTWRELRDLEKFEHVRSVARRFPKVRTDVAQLMQDDGMSFDRAVATAFRLLDRGYFRVGSDTYAGTNGSYGLTTLRHDHVHREGDELVFSFTGKSGVEQEIRIADPAVVDAVEAMRRRRGGPDELLAYRAAGAWRHLDAATVNEALRDLVGTDISAKDFRTWHGTVHAATALAELPNGTERQRKRSVVAAMDEVAELLGNTRAVARGSYVDPRVVDAFHEGQTISAAVQRASRRRNEDRRSADIERGVLRLLSGTR